MSVCHRLGGWTLEKMIKDVKANHNESDFPLPHADPMQAFSLVS
jgi:hypothetical protein